MAFDINTAKPATTGGFNMQTARPIEVTHPSHEDVPTAENLAKFTPRQDTESLGDKALGMGEAARAMISGGTTGAVGFVGGSLTGSALDLLGVINTDEALQMAQDAASAGTWEPSTDAGKRYLEKVGEVVGVLPPIMSGGIPIKPTGRAVRVAGKTKGAPVTTAAGTGKSFAKKAPEQAFSQNKYKAIKEVKKQGFDEDVTSMITKSNKNERRNYNKMVGVVEKGMKDAEFKAENRPVDIAGDALIKKYKFVQGENKNAGRQLGRVADKLEGKKVEVNNEFASFFERARDIGVKFDDDLKPDFEGSLIEFTPPARKIINTLALKIKRNQTPDAKQAHELKQFIDEQVTYLKTEKGLKGKAETIAKDLRRDLNESIKDISPEYAEANKRFADTITAVDALDSAIGKADLNANRANQALGTALRRVTSHAQSRTPIINAIELIEGTSNKYGGNFNDSIIRQLIFADEIDATFGGGARTSLRGEVKKAGIDTAVDLSQMSLPGAVAVGVKAGAKKLRGVNEKNQLKAIKNLLRAE